MLRKTMIGVALLGAALALAGCGEGSPSSGTQVITENTPVVGKPSATTVAQVQTIAQRTCKYIPYAKTVIDIFAASGTLLPTAAGIANRICEAVVNNPKTEGPRGGRTVPKVNGVPVKGKDLVPGRSSA